MCKKLIEFLYLRMKNNLAFYDQDILCLNKTYYKIVFFDKYKFKEFYFAYIDLNNLKRINNSFGHSAGDKFIKRVATTLMNYGTLIRVGGDEFILIIDNLKLKDFKKYSKDNPDFSCGISHKTKNDSLRILIHETDLKMMKSKVSKNKELLFKKEKDEITDLT